MIVRGIQQPQDHRGVRGEAGIPIGGEGGEGVIRNEAYPLGEGEGAGPFIRYPEYIYTHPKYCISYPPPCREPAE